MPYIGKPQSADAFRVTPSNIDSALKSGISGSNDSEMTPIEPIIELEFA